MTKGILQLAFLAAAWTVGLALAGTAAAADCKLIRLAEWPVRIAGNTLIVGGAINSRDVDVLIDTGAAESFLARSAAERLGLSVTDMGSLGRGFGGIARRGIAHLSEFKVGDALRRNWRVPVAGDDLGSVGFVLGYDFFTQAEVEFDLANGVVRLHIAKDCKKGAPLAYWAPGGASEQEMEWFASESRIGLTVLLNGQPARALLDSGASVSVVSERFAAGLGITPATLGVVAGRPLSGLGGKRDSWIVPFQSFAIGDEVIKNPRIRMSELGSEWSMILGADFLRSHRVLIANSQRKIYFTYVDGPVFQPPPREPAAKND